MDLQKYLSERGRLVEEALLELIPPLTENPTIIHEAMHYSVFAGGKRLRPILCLASAEALGQDPVKLLPIAGVLELIHTYSLIHDDLPAMDNDDYRRGKLTNHKCYGEGIAILAGDALLTLAFEALSSFGLAQAEKEPAFCLQILRVINEIAEASGTMGMIGGQVVDIQSEGKSIDGKVLEYIHTHKTGALFRASVRAGALFSGASQEDLAALTAYSEYFGLAFQITDDILDVSGNSAKMGKSVGSDLKKQKATYPTIYGLEKAHLMAGQAIDGARTSLLKLPGDTKPLEEIVNYLLERES